ncbi:MAG: DUF3078 domain-containing protein [Bacteroidales bacterium]|nr:DUF3078 domain-containing protein [Bacteroidales bacterium]MBQ8223031.1 DUF3078 domain-containing protein [Bacteroidales bacterium]
MTAFKLVLKRLYFLGLLLVLNSIIFPTITKGQDTIFNIPPYTIKIDTITRIDTTYIIDTIINSYTFIVTDTIYNVTEEDNTNNFSVHHKFEGNFGITLNQLAITHWAAGGESNGSGKVMSNMTYRYDRKLFNYVLNGIFAYGMSNYTKDKRYEKSEDRCEVSMTMSNNNSKNLTFTSIASLKTQFSNGYSYPNDSIPISRFFAPAYLNISAGYNYNIKDYLSVYISPIAGKMTFVTDQRLADLGSYGVEAGYWNVYNGDSTWVKGKNLLSELGINVLIKYKQNFKNKISIFSTLNLYNNYMDPNKSNRWNIDVDWETGLRFTINEHISAVINIHLIYDDNIRFAVTEIIDGTEITKQIPILQFKESLGISFLYKFATN